MNAKAAQTQNERRLLAWKTGSRIRRGHELRERTDTLPGLPYTQVRAGSAMTAIAF